MGSRHLSPNTRVAFRGAYLADRIDRGMDVEVATLMGAPVALDADGNEMTDEPAKKAQQTIVEFMIERRRLPKRDRPTLELPPFDDDDESAKPKAK